MTFVVLRDRLKIDEAKNHEKMLQKTRLFFSGRLRCGIVLVLALALGALLVPLFVPALATLALNAYFFLVWLVFLTLNTLANVRIRSMLKRFTPNDAAAAAADPEAAGGRSAIKAVKTKYTHIMATFAYKEPLALIERSLRNVCALNGSRDLITVVCLEERTPVIDYKIAEI